jgi:hypothetical protein
MRIRIDAVDLPGLTADGDIQVYSNIHVAVQRRGRPDELLDPQPGNAASATWTLQCTAVASPPGIDVKGPYVQGRPGDRFIYLSWGTVDESDAFTFTGFLRGCPALPAGEESDSCAAGQE